MAQVNIRAPEELTASWRDAARRSGRSLNGWIVAVLTAAVDPELAGDEAERVRGRLRRAGLLAEPVATGAPPAPPGALASARAAAGRGRPLSALVTDGR